MDAPDPIKYSTPDIEIIDENQLKEKYIFKNNNYFLNVKLLDEYLYLIVDKKDDDRNYQLKLNYEEITNKIPYFKFLTNINDIFKNILQLFKSDKYNIKLENKIIKVIIKIMNIFGFEENIELILDEIETSVNAKINKLKNRIKELESKIVDTIEEKNQYKKDTDLKIKKLIEEKKEMKIIIEKLKKENISIKNELKAINDKLNIILENKKNEEIKNRNENKNEIKSEIKNKIPKVITPEKNNDSINKKKFFEYTYDLLIYPKERTNEIFIYDKKNNFIKKTLKVAKFKSSLKFINFPFKTKFVNLGISLLLTGGSLNNKCFLISALETKNNIENYDIIITSYGNLKEKRESHSIIYLPDKNFVFVCSGYLTKSCEYTDISKGNWEEIQSLNNVRINASMAYINERYIYILGGTSFEEEKEIYLNNIEYFDINNFENGWKSLNFINDKDYNLSFCAFAVIPVDLNEFLICGGIHEKEYKTKTYKVNCNDYEHPIIEDINIHNNAVFIHNLFCKIGDAYFNFDFSAKLYKFDYKNLSLGVFNLKKNH